MPLDAARDGLIELQGQLIGVLAVQNAVLAERVAQLETANAELAERLARLERAVSRNSGIPARLPAQRRDLGPQRLDQRGLLRHHRQELRDPRRQFRVPGSQLHS
jgi:hypothetical protein